MLHLKKYVYLQEWLYAFWTDDLLRFELASPNSGAIALKRLTLAFEVTVQ